MLLSVLSLALTVMMVPFPSDTKKIGISTDTLQVYLPESSLVIFVKVKFEQSDVFLRIKLWECFFMLKISCLRFVRFFFQVTVILSNSPVKQQVMLTVSPSMTKTSGLWVTTGVPDDETPKKETDKEMMQ